LGKFNLSEPDMMGHFLLRLSLWLLLTANLSWLNIAIGVVIALLLPAISNAKEPLHVWPRMLWKLLIMIPQAYKEAFEMLIWPHRHEAIVRESAQSRSPQIIFLDVLLITFTPKTIVLKHDPKGWYEVHRVQRRQAE
jgi:multicomponent Na+:H+ antiporter subunit E